MVTAQFRRQKLQNTPLAITAITGSQLAARSQTSLAQITSTAPAVNLTPAGAGFGNAVTASIRGVGQYDFNFAFEPGVGIYIDDVYYGALFGSNFDLLDLSRVEILRGPQGTLEGKNSLGGALKLFTKAPGPTPDAFITAGYGAYNRVFVQAGTNYTVLDDKLFVRVTGGENRQDGFFKRYDYDCSHPGTTAGGVNNRLTNSCQIGTEGGQQVAGGRIAVRYVPDSNIEINLKGDLTEDNSEVQPTKLLYQTNPIYGGVNYLTGAHSYSSYSTYKASNCTGIYPATTCVNGTGFQVPPISTAHGYGFSGQVDWKLPANLSLTSITAYRRADGQFSQDADASPVDIETIYNAVVHEQVTQELRLSGSYNKLLDFTVGGFYYNANDNISGRKNIALAPNFYLNFQDNDPIKTTDFSGFAHTVVHVLPNFNITGGLRYTFDQKIYKYSRLDPVTQQPAFFVGGLNGLSGSFPGSGGYAGRLDYRINANYRFNPQVLVYGQVATGFKGGGVNPRPFFPNQALAFGPEKLTAFELGIKTDLFNHRLRLDGALFDNKYDNIQETLLTCPLAPAEPCALPANVANANIKGGEVEFSAHPTEAWEIDGSASYIDFAYTSFKENVGITKGMVAPFTTRWKTALGTQYDIDMGIYGMLTPRYDLAFQSGFFTNAVNGPLNFVPQRAVSNLRITYTAPNAKWQIAGSITNLFNRFYYLNKFDLSAGFGVVEAQPAPPREWLLALTRRF